MFKSVKKIFMWLLSSIINASNYTKYVLLSNQKCMIQHTLINLHTNEYSQDLHYYPFAVKLDRSAGSCNTLKYLSNKVCFPNKKEDLNLSVFNCECKCKFGGRNCNSNQWWNNHKCWCECRKRHVCEKDYVWNPATCNCENGKI